MKRKWVNIFFISLVAILCFNSPLLGQPPKASVPSSNPIKIGGSLPLTGIYSELGEDGNHVLTDAAWSSELPYPGNSQINQGAKERLKLPHVPDYFGLSYCWMKTLELAVQGAGTLDNTKIRDYLRSHTFDLPYGMGIKFDSRGLPSPFCFTLQATEGRNRLVWPKNVGATKLLYPRPEWSK